MQGKQILLFNIFYVFHLFGTAQTTNKPSLRIIVFVILQICPPRFFFFNIFLDRGGGGTITTEIEILFFFSKFYHFDEAYTVSQPLMPLHHSEDIQYEIVRFGMVSLK